MARCILTSATPTAEYTLPYNPVYYDPVANYNISPNKLLHGAVAWHDVKFDSRLRQLVWEGNSVDDSDITNMVTFFKNKRGMIYYINFQDMDDVNLLWPSDDTWKKIRIINIDFKIRRGGKLVYDSITLSIQPEE